MKLSAKKRPTERKAEVKEIRRAGNIPAVCYSPQKKGESIEVDGTEFHAALRQIKPGLLATTQFELSVDGELAKAIVKDIQYDLTSYRVIHLDFELLDDKTPVEVNVPVQCTGVVDCVGIKLGGFLRQVIRSHKVRCLPKDIPQSFEIDIRELKIKQSKRISDLILPAGVTAVSKADEVVVVIAKR